MRSLYQILSEGNIGDLKGVRYIRHYTTLESLANIIQNGYIKASESVGDNDWEGYDIGPIKVVSFHDARTDPELEFLLDANDKKMSMSDTRTLGIHMDKICCFIEYNFDLLPKDIQKSADFIKILEQYVPEFCKLWNELCKVKDIISKAKKGEVKDYKSLLKYLEDNNWPNFHDRIDGAYWDCDEYEQQYFVDMILKNKLKSYSRADEKALLQAAIADNEKLIFNILKQHGWKNGNEELPYFLKLCDWENHTFIEYLQKRFLKTNNEKVNIEIRIAHDMPINIKGCTIHFFQGVADYIFDNSNTFDYYDYEDLITRIVDMPNVEIYEPGDDYSLFE